MKILLAADGSEYSDLAAKFLTRLNLSLEDEITILHVISWVPFEYDRESYYESLKQIKIEIAPKILDTALDILKPVSARISTAILDGAPDKYIIDFAVDSNIDLIVMGARGLKGIKLFALGSVTRSVAINSPKPVLVIRQSPWEEEGKMRILFATDGSDHANATVNLLNFIPFPDDTEITIFNVIRSVLSDIPERFVMEINDRIKEVVSRGRAMEFAESEKIIEQARRYLIKRFPKINLLTKFGDPSTEILNEAEVLKADVIALGSRGLRGIKGMMGSVSRNILGQSKSSVLIGKIG
ncbi:MAG: universal stress protein [Nitrospirota bacterium]